MKGIILAGGEGKRMHPVTLEIPKPLITVKKKPLINYGIETLAKGGVKDIKVIIRSGHQDDYRKWLKVYGDEFALKGIMVEVIAEEEPMGTFGFIAHHLGDWINGENFFVMNSDDIKDVNIREMQKFHDKQDVDATIAIADVPNPEEYGVVILEGSKVKQFLEKQKSPLVSTISIGIYLFSPTVFAYVEQAKDSGRRYIMLENDVFPLMAAKGRLASFIHKGIYHDCGTLEKWKDVITKLQ